MTKREFILLAALVAMLLLPLCLVSNLPLSDYPSHLLSIQVIDQYDNPNFRFDKHFEVDWKIIPNLGSQLTILALAQLVDIEVAGRIYLILIWVGFLIAAGYFLAAVSKRKLPMLFFALLFCYSWYFHQGYINFWGSVSLSFWAIGFWLRTRVPMPAGRFLGLLLLISATYLWHLFGWLMLVGTVIFLGLFDPDRRRTLRPFLLAGLPSFLAFAYYFSGPGGDSVQGRGMGFEGFISNAKFFVSHTFANFDLFDLSLYALPLIALVSALALLLFRHLRQSSRLERNLLWLSLILMVSYFLLPRQFSAVWPFNLRVNFWVVLFAVAAVPTVLIEKYRRYLVIGCSVIALGIGCLTFFEYDRLSDRIDLYREGTSRVAMGSRILPLTDDIFSGWEYHIPMSTVWAYYHIERGGAGPYLFNLPHGQIVKYKSDKNSAFPAPSLYPHRLDQFDFDLHTAAYDYLILSGKVPEIQPTLDETFEIVFQNEEVRLYKLKEVTEASIVP